MTPTDATRPVILTIDDDPDVLASLKAILEAHGYTVVQASSAEEGLKAFKAKTPAMVIVDLMMEEVDAGANFVKSVKAAGGSLPIYMLSSVGDNLSTMTDYRELGLTGVLQKPISPEALLKLVKAKLS
jgi:DNA-binding response OmpR family regulator